MSNQPEIVENVFKEALSNPNQAEKFLENPLQAFREAGVDLPESDNGEFNSFLEGVAGGVLKNVKRVSMGERLPPTLIAPDGLFPDFACTACKVRHYGVAISIIAVGAGSIAALSIGSPLVAVVAAAAGASTTAALAFIQGLSNAIGEGVGTVVTRLCEFSHEC